MKVTLILFAWFMLFSQVSAALEEDGERALPLKESGVDVALSPIFLATIEAVDLDEMTIRIGNTTYKLPDPRASRSNNRIEVNLRDLRPGSEVLIQTDGTTPTATHRPMIHGIWKE